MAAKNKSIQEKLIDFFETVGEIGFFSKEIIRCSFSRPFYFRRVIEQIKVLGIDSLSITLVIGAAMGFVMALNFGYGLKKFGGTL